MVLQEPGTKTITDTRKRSRAFAITSLSLGLLSVSPLAIGGGPTKWFLIPWLITLPLAILGIIFGILQVTRRRSSRGLACAGIALSLVTLGVWSHHIIYKGIFHPLTYVEKLTERGYDRSVIDNPLPVELFRAVEQPSAQWVFSGMAIPFGWYDDDQEEEVRIETPLIGVDPTEPVSFDPGDPRFGFFIKLDKMGMRYKWYTESPKNKGESHVKIYPTIVDGREIPNSYLLCWEDYPLSLGPSTLVDFTDLIVRVDGVRPATAGADSSVP